MRAHRARILDRAVHAARPVFRFRIDGPRIRLVDERQRDAVALDLAPIALCAAARASGQTVVAAAFLAK